MESLTKKEHMDFIAWLDQQEDISPRNVFVLQILASMGLQVDTFLESIELIKAKKYRAILEDFESLRNLEGL